MPGRLRQSTAPGTPAPSRESRAPTATPGNIGSAQTIPLPAYEPPSHPLTSEARDKLKMLAREFPSASLTSQHQDILNHLSKQAGLISEEIYHIDQEKARRKRRLDKHGGEPDEDEENHAAEEVEKVVRRTTRMEGILRRGINGEHGVSVVEKALREIQTNAPVSSNTRPSQRGTRTQQSQAQTQTSRVTMDGEDESQQDEEMPDAPDAPPPPPALFKQFEASIQDQTDRYDAQSLSHRYASHPIYAGFKRNLHEGRLGPEAPPLENASRWFTATGGEAKPGVTELAEAGAGGDGDDDIVVARATVSTKCPITMREFEHPLTSTLCPHSFERAAILQIIEQSRPPPPRRGHAPPPWTPSVQCPVPGCDKRLTRADVREDRAVIDGIERAKRLERIRREMAAEDGEEDNDAEIIDSGEEEGGDDVDALLAPSVQVKKEKLRRTQMDDIEDDGDDDDGFEE